VRRIWNARVKEQLVARDVEGRRNPFVQKQSTDLTGMKARSLAFKVVSIIDTDEIFFSSIVARHQDTHRAHSRRRFDRLFPIGYHLETSGPSGCHYSIVCETSKAHKSFVAFGCKVGQGGHRENCGRSGTGRSAFDRVMTAIPSWQAPRRQGSWARTSARWCMAALVALTAHGLAIWFCIRHEPAVQLDLRSEPAAGMDISVVAPDEPAEAEAASSNQETARNATLDEEQAASASKSEAMPDVTPVQPPVVELPKLPPPEATDLVSMPVRRHVLLPQHEVKPPVHHETVRQVMKRPPRPSEASRPSHQEDRSSRATRSGPRGRERGAAGPRVSSSVARSSSVPQGAPVARASPAAWQSAVLAHLNRFKRSPGGGSGVATVAFVIDRAGHVLSARLVRSAGSAMLDAEALTLPRRASPVPSPPAGVGSGGILSLTVPVRFN
jgi:protein TonB